MWLFKTVEIPEMRWAKPMRVWWDTLKPADRNPAALSLFLEPVCKWSVFLILLERLLALKCNFSPTRAWRFSIVYVRTASEHKVWRFWVRPARRLNRASFSSRGRWCSAGRTCPAWTWTCLPRRTSSTCLAHCSVFCYLNRCWIVGKPVPGCFRRKLQTTAAENNNHPNRRRSKGSAGPALDWIRTRSKCRWFPEN